jgi:lysophospholipase L1-like esterase
VSYTRNFSVTLDPQVITFSPPPDQTYVFGAAPLTVSATASSGLPVSFSSATPSVCSVAGNTVTLLTSGTCTIVASQSGSSAYAPAPQVQHSFSVQNVTLSVGSLSPTFLIAGSEGLDITLIGTGFFPATTATYAGIAHSITYVNPTTMVLSLTTDDLATPGIQPIVLSNQSPAIESATINLPVMYETDAMVQRSQLAIGDQARMQALIQKARTGVPVTIATMGGSITTGLAASDLAHSYAQLLQNWWSHTFPASPSTWVNAGISGTPSDYGSLRAQRDVLSNNPDLVIVEFAVNDGTSALSDTYEGLVRQLLNAPSHPAVILLFLMRYQPNPGQSVTAEPWQSIIGDHYNLPMVSFFDAINPELTSGTISINQLTPDGVHPNDLGHAYIAQFLEQNLQNAIDDFAPDTAPQPISATAAPLYSTDFEFTSLVEGNGTWGAPLNPTNNQGWVTAPAPWGGGIDSPWGGSLDVPGEGLESSTPGSTLDFIVVGREILIGYWRTNGPMGEISVSVDGGPANLLEAFYATVSGAHIMSRVADGLAFGAHQVHVELLSTKSSASTGNEFNLLSVGAGGVQQ